MQLSQLGRALPPVVLRQSQKPPPDKGKLVSLPQGCVAAASVLEGWTGLGPQSGCSHQSRVSSIPLASDGISQCDGCQGRVRPLHNPFTEVTLPSCSSPPPVPESALPWQTGHSGFRSRSQRPSASGCMGNLNKSFGVFYVFLIPELGCHPFSGVGVIAVGLGIECPARGIRRTKRPPRQYRGFRSDFSQTSHF